MENLNVIKEKIKVIQKNFNPEKNTYKTFDKLIKNDYSVDDMIDMLSRIRGIGKYPDDIKKQFSSIVDDLKVLKDSEQYLDEKEVLEQELIKKEEEEKEKIRKQQEENTRELKDIIENIEKSSIKKKNQKTIERNDLVENHLNNTLEEVDDESNDNDLENFDGKSFDFGSEKVSFVLIGLILICIISLILIFIFY